MTAGANVEAMSAIRTPAASDPVAATDRFSPMPQLLLTAVPPAIIIALVLWWVIGWPAIIVGAAAGFGLAWLFASRADDAVLAVAGGAPGHADDAARLLNVVEGLALTAGIAPPDVRIRDDRTANAMAVGRAGGDTAIIVTRGLLDALDRLELEGVVAHLLVRLRSQDQERRTLTVTTTGLPRYLMERFGGARGPGGADPDIGSQMLTDREAVRLTRYPPGLLSALERLMEHGTAIDDAGPISSQFWLAPVDGDLADLETRTDALREL